MQGRVRETTSVPGVVGTKQYKLNLQDWVERIAVNNWFSFQRFVTLFCAATIRRSHLTFRRYLHHYQSSEKNICSLLLKNWLTT